MSIKKNVLQSALVCSFLAASAFGIPMSNALASQSSHTADITRHNDSARRTGLNTSATAPDSPLVQIAQTQQRKRTRSKRTGRTRRGAAAVGAGAATGAAAGSGPSGRYAVLRDKNKDAGCLLSLNRNGRAVVGPGCQDHGIQVFDPVRWQMSGGKIVLQARGGHRISFTRSPDGNWQKMPAGKKALGLKKY